MSKGKGKSGRGGGGASASKGNNKLQQVQNMSDEEFAGYLDSIKENKLDSSYANIDLQRMILDCGINDKPTVVSSEQFDAYLKQNPNAEVFYRGVKPHSSITAEGIQDQMRYSDTTHVGGGIYGDGLYFTTKAYEAAFNYAGFVKGDEKGGAVSRMMLKPNAKIISEDELMKKYSKLPRTLKNQLKSAGGVSTWGNDGQSQLALKLGYQGIYRNLSFGKNKRNHVIVIDRGAMIMDSSNVHGID